MPSDGIGLRWGVEQRLEFIEFRLFWEGGVNRSDITHFFGVSVPQASKDLTQYQELAPFNIRYDRSEKRYFAATDFKPLFLKPDADSYLSQLNKMAGAPGNAEQSWVTNPPSVDTMPVPLRRVDVETLRAILAAIRDKASVNILYQSMSEHHPDPIWRRISPHAFGSDGFRWHIRAYCHIDNKFKDFLLSRTMQAKDLQATAVDGATDRFWNSFFDVILEPNPKLGRNQRRIIAQDYAMPEERITIPVRQALLYYFRKRLRLDVADALDDPHETPVVVSNRMDFDLALAEAAKSVR